MHIAAITSSSASKNSLNQVGLPIQENRPVVFAPKNASKIKIQGFVKTQILDGGHGFRTAHIQSLAKGEPFGRFLTPKGGGRRELLLCWMSATLSF